MMRSVVADWRAWMLLAVAWLCGAMVSAAEVRYELAFPNPPGYQTLVCDFHMHTVFSDGSVWPPTRVNEAWRQGLDAIAITDHLEYQPHKADVSTDFERSYQLMEGPAKTHRMLLVKGAEITRDTPPGHFNCLFLKEIKPLFTPEFLDAIRAANEQGAFVFWNHQGWKGEEKGQWQEVHTQMFEKKWFQGMEVANGEQYYPTAHQWCLEKNLTMLGNTDIHEPDVRLKSLSNEHRTMNLLFVKEATLDGLKEALKAGRTAVWYKDQLIGRPEWLEALFKAGIHVGQPTVRAKTGVTVEVRNDFPADICLERPGAFRLEKIVLPAKSTSLLKLTVPDGNKPAELEYTATTLLVAPGKCLTVKLSIPGR